MTFCNANYFVPPEYPHTFLAARGFDPQGTRSGGIINPSKVNLNPGAVLFRFFHDPAKQYGEWWATPHELALLLAYFGRDGGAFDSGRAQGKGILQGTMAVRHEWGGFSPDHMGQYWVARVVQPMHAFFGEGDVAPSVDQSQLLRPVQIDAGGRRRNATQVFLRKPWTYQGAFIEIDRGHAGVNLSAHVMKHSAQKLYFEV